MGRRLNIKFNPDRSGRENPGETARTRKVADSGKNRGVDQSGRRRVEKRLIVGRVRARNEYGTKVGGVPHII